MTCRGVSIERALFGLAGAVTMLSVVLAIFLDAWFLALAAFAALNQWLYAWRGWCPAALVLGRTPCFTREVTR